MGNENYNPADFSKSQSGLLLPHSMNIKSERESTGINQTETGPGQKTAVPVTRDQLDDRLRLFESESKLRASEANGQLVSRLVTIEHRVETVSKDVQRVEAGNSSLSKELRDAKRWAIGLIIA